ncbi:alanine racemase [candidate division WOR-3 bacterium]|nr:alanine racemase [candidate division WOR-3 bacterium]
MRPSRVVINLSNFEANIETARRQLGGTKLLAVVKADAYGHGAVAISSRAVACGVDWLGVGIVEEGIELREAGIRAPVLILSQELEERVEEIIQYNLFPTVCSRNFLESLNREGKRQKKVVKLFIMLDTGMGRYGVAPDEFIYFLKRINSIDWVRIEGVMSHFPVAGVDYQFTSEQIKRFKSLIQTAESMGISIPVRSIANSAAFLEGKNSVIDMARLGLILYGISPIKDMDPGGYLPVMTVKSKISFIKNIPPGHSVSYARSFIAKRPTTVAVVPIGYADGYDRKLSNKGWMMVKGARAQVIGDITMDATMIDITDIPEVKIGDEVIIVNHLITAWDMANTIGTIPYEIVCRMGKRLPRLYI